MAAFVYQIKGRNIVLLEQDVYGYWVTPLNDKTDRLRIEFTYRDKFLDPSDSTEWNTAADQDGDLNESAIIDLPEPLAKALVCYVKARLFEDEGNIEMKEYFMREFEKFIDTYEISKTSGMGQTMVGSWGIK